ncbi:MAG: putative terminase large subunit [Prokaryotic dsDNA virus sp.]|nr:MAG: putative terminase large subunit [Prokaryotic dsDNA virus sp.]
MTGINKKYLVFDNPTRYFIITGGRSSGKSYSVNTILCSLMNEVGHVILFTRYTMTSAHISIIPEFLEKIKLFQAEGGFIIRRDEIIYKKTGSRIIFKGIKTSSGNQVANLKSLQGVTTWVLDEAEELVDEKIFDTIDLSVRQKDIHNRVIMIMNPATKEHFIYQRFFEDAGVEAGTNGVKKDVTYIHTTYMDNAENLSENYIRQLDEIKVKNPEKYNHIILGGWLNKAEGVVFSNWSFGEFNPDGLQTSCGMDFGFSVDPDTLIEVAIDKKKNKIYLKEHIYQRGIKTHILGTMIKDRVGDKLIIADSAEPRLIEDLRYAKVNIQAVKKGTIESGIVRMQDFEIIVEENSTNIAKEMNNYAYADKGSKLYIDKWNHAIDAARYNVIYHLDNPNKGKYYIQ